MSEKVIRNIPIAPARPETVSSDVAIAVRDLGKCYRIYQRPQHRLKQAFFRGRRQYFSEFWALRDISMEVRHGETVGIMGRNGCGKSTLLQLICNTLTPTVGQINIHGRVAALLELGSGFDPEFTGRDNIFTCGAILGLSREEIQHRYEDIVAFAELEDFIDRPVKTYSSGMYVRLAFAVAISVEPDILVIDEALSVGDEAFQRKCFARIQSIQDRGGTILFVSHSAQSVINLCNRAVLLDQGELLMTGRPKDVVTMYQRLLYAPADQSASIREGIKRGDGNSQCAKGKSETTKSSQAELALSIAGPSEDTPEARYDPEMRPKSTVVYQSNGAEIIDPHLTTLSGRRVNVLVPHEEYQVRYHVRFTKPAYQVLWGTVMKTIEGVVVSSMMKPSLTDRFDHVAAGSEAELSFRFRCSLMPGVYFGNVGVCGIAADDDKESFLHRMVDVLTFRVLAGYNRSASGVADIFCSSNLSIKSTSAMGAA